MGKWGYTFGMQQLVMIGLMVAGFSVGAALPPHLQKFEIAKPTPEWGGERIKLPPGFAPKLGLKGIEEILFAPGMFKAEAQNFFTYVFLFALEQKPVLTAEVLRRELLVYYTGLSKARLNDPKLDVSKFTVKLEPVKENGVSPKGALNVKSYRAEVVWLEPFTTKKMQTLHFELQTWQYKGSANQYLFVSASPQKSTVPIWKTMRGIRASVKLKPAK
jgi:hypothetical protein